MRRFRVAVGGALLVAALLSGCAPSEEETTFLERQAILERQNQGIRELIAEAEQGTLIPVDRFLVGIDEKILLELLRSQLPLERPLGKRFVVRLEQATVQLTDKYGLMTIEGEVHRIATPQRKTKVRVLGGLGAVQVDSTTNTLSVKIAVDRVELLEAGLLEGVLGRNGRKFISDKGRELLEDKLPTLKVPVSLAQDIRVPAFQEGSIQLDSLRVPLDVSVERVIAVGGKLWLTLQAEVGTVVGAEEGLGVSVGRKSKKAGTPGAGNDSSAGGP